ncbi:hypothetical protein OIU84_029012 [Salix udensis]|uniref:Uncharacterized protein n=1 Tax=Salix udensis TaxID=889485 RepID=A0AAD6P9Q9_9ROSI|nr:hypothetical protein OIU84_029012 [Salix udensis]
MEENEKEIEDNPDSKYLGWHSKLDHPDDLDPTAEFSTENPPWLIRLLFSSKTCFLSKPKVCDSSPHLITRGGKSFAFNSLSECQPLAFAVDPTPLWSDFPDYDFPAVSRKAVGGF